MNRSLTSSRGFAVTTAGSGTIAPDASTPAVAKSFGASYLAQLAITQIDTYNQPFNNIYFVTTGHLQPKVNRGEGFTIYRRFIRVLNRRPCPL